MKTEFSNNKSLDTNFIYEIIKFKRPITLKFMIGYDYYYNGKQEIMLCKLVRFSGISHLNKIIGFSKNVYCSWNSNKISRLYFIDPNDIKSAKIIAIADSSFDAVIDSSNFDKRFRADPMDVINIFIQRALLNTPLKLEKDDETGVTCLVKDFESEKNFKNNKFYNEFIKYYPNEISNRELFFSAKLSFNEKYPIECDNSSDNKFIQNIKSLYELPLKMQHLINKYDKTEQLEFDFSE